MLGGGEIADPDECASICELGVDMLAAGIGNIHGVYPENWAGLRLDVLAQIQEKRPAPWLWFCTAAPAFLTRWSRMQSQGVSKINVNTECQIVFTAAVRKYFEENMDQQKKGFDQRKVLKPGFEAIKEKVKEKMELFGSINKSISGKTYHLRAGEIFPLFSITAQGRKGTVEYQNKTITLKDGRKRCCVPFAKRCYTDDCIHESRL